MLNSRNHLSARLESKRLSEVVYTTTESLCHYAQSHDALYLLPLEQQYLFEKKIGGTASTNTTCVQKRFPTSSSLRYRPSQQANVPLTPSFSFTPDIQHQLSGPQHSSKIIRTTHSQALRSLLATFGTKLLL